MLIGFDFFLGWFGVCAVRCVVLVLNFVWFVLVPRIVKYLAEMVFSGIQFCVFFSPPQATKFFKNVISSANTALTMS